MTAIIKNIFFVLAVLLLAYAAFLFMKFNRPIINRDILLYTTLSLNLLGFLALLFISGQYSTKALVWGTLVVTLAAGAFLIYSLLTSVLIDYFQPLALYDKVIYLAIAGLSILLVLMVSGGIWGVVKGGTSLRPLMTALLMTLFILQFYGLGGLQKDLPYSNIEGEPMALFDGGEGGYKTFRIPTLLVLPAGSVLANGEKLEKDRVIAMAEARRNASLDHGDIDLVQKISDDNGATWSELMVVRTYDQGEGKIGNSTPVFDAIEGTIVLPHLAGVQEKTGVDTWLISSGDGGMTWSEAGFIYEGAVGPGHGIMISSGPYMGRLVVPGYHKGGSLSLYSDDHGKTWQFSEKLSDGNEAEIAQINDRGDLMMVVRTNIGVSKTHDPLEKLYVISTDGGESWSDFTTMEGIKEPICMSSIVRSGDRLYYSYPDDFYSRGRMTIAASSDQGKSFSEKKLIYEGASGYSELAALSDGSLLLLFEGGAIQYNEQLRLVKVRGF